MAACLAPNGPTVYESDRAPRRLYIGTRTGVVILERSSPDNPWRNAARALDGKHISSLMCASDGAWVAAGCHDGGFYFSADEGRTFERRDNGLVVDHVFSLAKAGAETAPTFYAGTQPVSLYRSDDFGRSWQELPALAKMPGSEKWWFPDPHNTSHTKSITIDCRDASMLYAAVEQGGLFKSENAGKSWRELDGYYRESDPLYRDIHRIVQVPSSPDRLYMATGIGLYRSEDAGATWERLTDTKFRIGYPDHLVVSPLDPQTIFMCGARHDPMNWLKSHFADSTVLTSTDGGRSWSDADKGLPESRRANIEAMCMASYPGGFTLFAGNSDGEVFECKDGSGSWSPIANLDAVSKLGHFRLVAA